VAARSQRYWIEAADAAGGSTLASGWPETMRLMLGLGPPGPIFKGVWQSLQPAIATSYLPRATFSAVRRRLPGPVAPK
jgi:hypothetical protein